MQLSCISNPGSDDDLGILATVVTCSGDDCAGRRPINTPADAVLVPVENPGGSTITGQQLIRVTFDRAVRADRMLLVCDGGLTMSVRQHSQRTLEATFFRGLNCKMVYRNLFVTPR